MKTKPFNLEEALAKPGRVICRDGVKPSELHYFKQCKEWRFTRPGDDKMYLAKDNGRAYIHSATIDLLLTCETKLVPFDHTNCPVGRIVIPKDNKAKVLLTGALNSDACVNGVPIPYGMLLRSYTFEDGTPCGVEVEE